MKRVIYCFVVVTTLVGISAAQSGPARYNLDFGPTGVFPLSGFRTFGDSAGPGWRGGSELLLIKHLGAEAGFTEGWPVGTDTCDRFGCTYSRHSLNWWITAFAEWLRSRAAALNSRLAWEAAPSGIRL